MYCHGPRNWERNDKQQTCKIAETYIMFMPLKMTKESPLDSPDRDR